MVIDQPPRLRDAIGGRLQALALLAFRFGLMQPHPTADVGHDLIDLAEQPSAVALRNMANDADFLEYLRRHGLRDRKLGQRHSGRFTACSRRFASGFLMIYAARLQFIGPE